MAGEKEAYVARMRRQYESKQKVYMACYYIDTFLQFIIVGGAAAVPILLLISDIPKTIPTIVSGIVAITAALANYYKPGERSRIHRTTSEALIKEIDMWDFRIGPYKNLDENQAFDLFVERTELVLEEHTKKVFSMKPSQQAQQIEINK